MHHAVIMAGGSGTRLWPLSRRMRPKQLLRLFDGESLLQLARLRLDGLFEPDNIWVITSANYVDLVAEALPDIPRANLIGEPVGRDTANAIGLAAGLLEERDPDATMAVFTADHIIKPREPFANAITAGLRAAEKYPTSLVTFGITPAGPHTGYGYVRRGEVLAASVYRVQEFKEKPTLTVAREYIDSGEYYWNSGMFAWRVSAIQDALRKHLPDNAAALAELVPEWDTSGAAEQFAKLPKISIDFGVMEKAADVLVVEMKCQWLDLGSWSAIAQTGLPDADENISIAVNGLSVKGRRNVLVAEDDHAIITLGVSDIVVVHAGDATLVCHRDHEQAIKDLARLRQQRFGDRLE